jgi:hypothetical protein
MTTIFKNLCFPLFSWFLTCPTSRSPGKILAAILLCQILAFIPKNLFADQEAEQALCELKSSKNTSAPKALTSIKRACNFFSLPSSTMQLRVKERTYFNCILTYMPGTEEDNTAIDILANCQKIAYP